MISNPTEETLEVLIEKYNIASRLAFQAEDNFRALQAQTDEAEVIMNDADDWLLELEARIEKKEQENAISHP